LRYSICLAWAKSKTSTHFKRFYATVTENKSRGVSVIVIIVIVIIIIIKLLQTYSLNKQVTSSLHAAVVKADDRCTPLDLVRANANELPTDEYNNKVKRQWSQKALHGRHPCDLSQRYVDTESSNKWLTNADLFAKTEGFLTAIQDQVILTRNYKKYILKQPDTDELCRRSVKESDNPTHYCSM